MRRPCRVIGTLRGRGGAFPSVLPRTRSRGRDAGRRRPGRYAMISVCPPRILVPIPRRRRPRSTFSPARSCRPRNRHGSWPSGISAYPARPSTTAEATSRAWRRVGNWRPGPAKRSARTVGRDRAAARDRAAGPDLGRVAGSRARPARTCPAGRLLGQLARPAPGHRERLLRLRRAGAGPARHRDLGAPGLRRPQP